MPDAREQAEAVARWCGWEAKARTKPSFADPSKMIAAPPVWVHCELGIRQSLPDYAASLDAMREVEDEIERRNLLKLYGFFLGCVVAGSDEQYWDFTRDDAFLAGATATALQRLQAAARVIEEVEP